MQETTLYGFKSTEMIRIHHLLSFTTPYLFKQQRIEQSIKMKIQKLGLFSQCKHILCNLKKLQMDYRPKQEAVEHGCKGMPKKRLVKIRGYNAKVHWILLLFWISLVDLFKCESP